MQNEVVFQMLLCSCCSVLVLYIRLEMHYLKNVLPILKNIPPQMSMATDLPCYLYSLSFSSRNEHFC